MQPERDRRLYLEDMLEFSQDVIDYAQGLTLVAWQADAMRVDATLRKLSLIGEAATRVPDAIRSQAPGIPWRSIPEPRPPSSIFCKNTWIFSPFNDQRTFVCGYPIR